MYFTFIVIKLILYYIKYCSISIFLLFQRTSLLLKHLIVRILILDNLTLQL